MLCRELLTVMFDPMTRAITLVFSRHPETASFTWLTLECCILHGYQIRTCIEFIMVASTGGASITRGRGSCLAALALAAALA